MKMNKLFEEFHKEAPFGMFIHWGVYALTEYHEQYLMRTKADRADYEQLFHSFNPTEYNPEEWVLMAKEAGMNYICFTTKHHDGFCLWDTKSTKYNIMNTPYQKDVLKMLQQACKKHDMKLSLYYSIPDWHQENAYNSKSTHQIPPRENDEPNMEKYIGYVKEQITELLTNYGEIATLFWDICPQYRDLSVNQLVRELQPNILINDRGFDEGDFATPERFVPEGNVFCTPTEACQSLGSQAWSYRSNEDYYSCHFLEQNIDKIMAMGGNYLLNVGPMANGKIPDRAKNMLHQIGSWYHSCKEAFENCTSILLFKDKPNILTTIRENTLYVHIFGGLQCSGIVLDPITVLPESVTVLNTMKTPSYGIDKIPTYYQREDGQTAYLHIYDLPCDELGGEPVVIRLETMTEEDLLMKLEGSRDVAAEGNYKSANTVVSAIRNEYGL